MIKLFGLTLLAGLSMSIATVVSAGVFLATGGIALCRVATPEVSLTIPVPTHLVDAGLVVAHFAIPDAERAEIRREVEPWMPMIDAAGQALADLPNGSVLVSVKTAEETVLIGRRLGRFDVDVEAPDADVHVSFPARSVKRIARRLTDFL